MGILLHGLSVEGDINGVLEIRGFVSVLISSTIKSVKEQLEKAQAHRLHVFGLLSNRYIHLGIRQKCNNISPDEMKNKKILPTY